MKKYNYLKSGISCTLPIGDTQECVLCPAEAGSLLPGLCSCLFAAGGLKLLKSDMLSLAVA